MATKPIQIVVVDDNLEFRKCICNILENYPYLQVICEAENGLAAVQAVEKHRPDIVLMDISMPVLDGIEATSIISARYPEARVIVLTMHDEESISKAAFKAGAFWCLNKACSPNEIIGAIRTAEI